MMMALVVWHMKLSKRMLIILINIFILMKLTEVSWKNKMMVKIMVKGRSRQGKIDRKKRLLYRMSSS